MCKHLRKLPSIILDWWPSRPSPLQTVRSKRRVWRSERFERVCQLSGSIVSANFFILPFPSSGSDDRPCTTHTSRIQCSARASSQITRHESSHANLLGRLWCIEGRPVLLRACGGPTVDEAVRNLQYFVASLVACRMPGV